MFAGKRPNEVMTELNSAQKYRWTCIVMKLNACYAAQGQGIVMENYRKFINPAYSVRQVLVEHQHFNEPEKCNFIKRLLLDCVKQKAIPIINYNDSVSNDETRKMELLDLRQRQEKVVECIDNDETASEIAALVKSEFLVILTLSVGGLFWIKQIKYIWTCSIKRRIPSNPE